VAELLVDVLLQVARERRCQRIAFAQLTRPRERRFGQRDGRADDLVLEDQVLGPELGKPRMLDQRVVGDRERADDQVDLPPQAEACRACRRARRCQ
jgi:hypothetical protein